MKMVRTTFGLASALLLLTAGAWPVSAQFGSIFGPPRPPADVPQPEVYQDDRFPREPGYDPWRRQRQREREPEPPPPPLTRLPPPAASPGGYPDVRSEPLPPPPGGTAAPRTEEAGRPPAAGPGQPPLAGLPPGQRQPRGEPQPGFSADGGIVVPPPKERIVNPAAVFAGLDKITGRIISFDVSIDETVQFGALRLTPRACYTRPPTEPPNTDGFVEVDEITLQGEVKRVFTGWMFAASPGLNAVEHPIYDVWLTDCKQAPPQVASAGEGTAGSAPAQPAAGAAAESPPAASRQPVPRNPPNPPIRR
jgi:hypothetical protein